MLGQKCFCLEKNFRTKKAIKVKLFDLCNFAI